MAGNKNSRKKWLCLDCGLDTGKAGEHFFLIDEVWSLTGLGHLGMLCIEHVEMRIGRLLVPADFSSAWINGPRGGWKSQRLANRLGLIEDVDRSPAVVQGCP